MSANTETTGAPEGYVECPKNCGRWMATQQFCCWRCFHPNASAETLTRYDHAGCGDWTPPIAAPAAHVERRKGQRWRSDGMLGSKPYVVEGTLSNLRDFGGSLRNGWDLADATVNGKPSTEMVFYEAVWGISGRTMTLIADATPEPAKATTPQCESFCRPGLRCKYCTTEVAPAAPPAHEAPTAAPVLSCACASLGLSRHRPECGKPPAVPAGHCSTCLSTTNVADRVTKSIGTGYVERNRRCDVCYLADENERTRGAITAGKPYAGPERLPKPQPAADWVEDCLPEAGR